MKVTLKYLSEKSGLSKTAVSLILNNKKVRVSEEKRKLVMDLADEYNYIPNSMAVGLATKKTRTIGLIIPDITNLFFAEIAKKVQLYLNNKGYSLILCNTNDDKELESKCADFLLNRGIDALIICVTSETLTNCEFLNEFKKNNIHCIAFDRWHPLMDCPSVSIDNEKGAYLAVKYLIDKGHKKISCLTGPIKSYSAKMRLDGYRKALTQAGIVFDDKLIADGGYHFQGGYEQGKKILELDVTAVFVSNDLMAYGFYKAAREAKKRIPEDISIIGFDDLYFSDMIDVPLTSVKQNIDELSKQIFNMVTKSIEGEKVDDHIFLPTTIVERNSVKSIHN